MLKIALWTIFALSIGSVARAAPPADGQAAEAADGMHTFFQALAGFDKNTLQRRECIFENAFDAGGASARQIEKQQQCRHRRRPF